MGNYKSRPSLSCAGNNSDELKKRISEGYAIVRSRLNDDIKPRFDARSPLYISCFQGTKSEFDEQLATLSAEERGREEKVFALLQQICIGVSEQSDKIRHLLANFVADHSSDGDKRTVRVSHLLRQCTRNGFSALHIAVYKGELDSVVALLDAGADVNFVVSANVPPPLHLAAMTGHADVALALLKRGADVGAVDFVRFSALHCAVYFGNEHVVRALLREGADANCSGGVHDRPLHIASARPYPVIVRILLDAGADPGLVDDEGNTSLHFAAKTGHLAVIESLLGLEAGSQRPSTASNTQIKLILQTNLYGDTALHTACYAGRFDAASRLLAVAGSAVLNTENVFSETPLMAACTSGRSLELVGFLMRQPGIDPNFQAQDGHTALHSACYHGHLRVVQYLLDNGADQSLTARALDNPLDSRPSSEQANVDGMPKAGTVASTMSALSSRLNAGRQGAFAPSFRASPSAMRRLTPTTTLLSPDMVDNNIDQLFQQQPGQQQLQTPVLWAYERGHDQIVALLKYYANKHPDSDVCSEYSSGDSSYTPLPSPLGRLRSMTKEKTEILQLRAELRSSFHATLADVELKEIIGHGSFGKVYRGILVRNGRTVAIKRYRALAFGAKTEVDLFCREVLILSRLKHINVIGFIGACMDDPSQFAIITEFVSAGSLFSLLHVQKRVFEMALRLSVSIDVARGMHYLHDLASQPVIHRDLNSHNILLHGERARAVIADFGESRFAAANEHAGAVESQMTKQPGNLRWMAPEVFTQCCRYDNKVDVFSYALVVWELHAAELPFARLKPAAAAAEMAYKHSRPALPPQPSTQFPAHILDLLKMAWHTDAIARPSFAQILQILEPHGPSEDERSAFNLSGKPETESRDSPSDECWDGGDPADWSATEDDAEICGQQKTVTRLKSRWENMSNTAAVSQPSGSSAADIGNEDANNKTPSAVERLRGQLDHHGYVSQAARAVAAAKSASQLRDSFVLARSANIAERQNALKCAANNFMATAATNQTTNSLGDTEPLTPIAEKMDKPQS